MKMKTTILLITLLIGFGSAIGQTDKTKKGIKEIIIHYYSVKMVDGMPVKNKLKDCFSCNQGRVFDKNGKELELRFYKADMKNVYGIDKYVYNKQGKKIGSEYFDEKGKHTTDYKYQYDALGRLKFSRAYSKETGKMLYGSEYDYDNRGNQYETASLNKDGEINDYYRREYNIYGLPVLENIVDKNNKPTFKVRYEYMPCGTKDWVDQITYYNGKLSEIRNREVIYYESEKNKQDS